MLPEGFRQLRILVVDDVAQARKLLRGVLGHLGIREILESASRADAFARVRVDHPDVVITDWSMPGGSGLELIRDIRNDPASPDPALPVILLTAHGGRQEVIHGRDAGATDFLVKPFTSAAVVARLQDVVLRQRGIVLAPGYRGPDRRRVRRIVAQDRRGAPRSGVLVLPPDGLLKAKVSGDRAAQDEAEALRAATAAVFARQRSHGALLGLLEMSLSMEEVWPEALARMAGPVARLLHDADGGLSAPDRAFAQRFQAFIAEGGEDQAMARRMVEGMRAVLTG